MSVPHMRQDRVNWLVAAIGVAALCLVFRLEIGSAITVWASSTAYGHCWLVLPIVAWLLWERRSVIQTSTARPAVWAVLLAGPLVLAWVVSRWLGVMEGRQLAAVGFVLVVLLAALGWRLWWALSAAFLYLVFLVPFGAFITPSLQGFTAGFIAAGLRALDIPFEADSFQISIPEGVFYVAEACAGLRFLIASVAFGVLYAVTMFRSPARRAGFIAISCVVPVVANGVRALGVVVLGHVLGSAQAGAADHLVYGWVFFSLVIVLLALSGLPFREVSAFEAAVPVRSDHAPARPVTAAALCGAIVVCALSLPMLASRNVHANMMASVPSPLRSLPGCTAGPSEVQNAIGTADFACGGQTIRFIDTVLPRGADPARILGAAKTVATSGLGDDLDTQIWRPSAIDAPWMLVRDQRTGRAAAYAVQVDGVQGVGGLHDRIRMVHDMFDRNGPPPVARAVQMIGGLGEEDSLKAVLGGMDRHASPSRQSASLSR